MDTNYPVVLEVEYSDGSFAMLICEDPAALYFNLVEVKHDKNFKDAKLFGLVEIEFPNLDAFAEEYEDDYDGRDEVISVGDWMEDH